MPGPTESLLDPAPDIRLVCVFIRNVCALLVVKYLVCDFRVPHSNPRTCLKFPHSNTDWNAICGLQNAVPPSDPQIGIHICGQSQEGNSSRQSTIVTLTILSFGAAGI